MQKLFIVFSMLMALYIAYTPCNAGAENIDIELNNFLNKSETLSKVTVDKAELADIEKEIYNIDPEIVAQNKNKSDDNKLAAYVSFVAKKSFEWYENYFHQRIRHRAAETGRDLIITGDYWHLHNGILEAPECTEQNPDSWAYGRSICQRPKGHENVIFSYNKDRTSMFYIEDKADEHLMYMFSVDMSISEDGNNVQGLFSAYADVLNYDYFFEDENNDISFRARYAKYTRKEFEKIQKKSSEVSLKRYFDGKSKKEINQILKESGLIYDDERPDVGIKGTVRGKVLQWSNGSGESEDE